MSEHDAAGLSRLSALAIELIADAARADHWLHTPRRYLGGAPIDLLETDEGAPVVVRRAKARLTPRWGPSPPNPNRTE
jgi:uncharacterized protein (DUF2384 family)